TPAHSGPPSSISSRSACGASDRMINMPVHSTRVRRTRPRGTAPPRRPPPASSGTATTGLGRVGSQARPVRRARRGARRHALTVGDRHLGVRPHRRLGAPRRLHLRSDEPPSVITLLDAGPLVVVLDRSDKHHSTCAKLLNTRSGLLTRGPVP